MLEIITILAAITLLIVTPIQTSQICGGKVSPKFKGAPEAYAAAFRKQATMLIWLGLALGALDLVMVFIEAVPGERIVKLIAAVLWFGVSGMGFYSSRRLARLPAPTDAGGASA